MSKNPRQSMILTAIRLFQSGGYAATSWRKLVKEADAPWGSARHYFPGGKEQLGAEAIGVAAQLVAARMNASFLPGRTPGEAVRALFTTTAGDFERSGFRAGCPVATVALERTPASDGLTRACADALQLWRTTIREGLTRSGMPADSADTAATTILLLYEGALLVARVTQSSAPLLDAAAKAERMVDSEPS